jgi:hypothetical protein
MSKEILRQYDMFSGELVDTRSRRQKRRDRKRELPRQAEMFSQRELAQFGVEANPKLPLAPKTRLELAIEDHRNEEERLADSQREAEKRTYPLPEVQASDDAWERMDERV